jgi:hypothetical protein
MKKILAWHFVRADRKLGYNASDLTVEPGYIYSQKPPLEMCRRGMHASRKALDALEYTPGPVICRVACWGSVAEDTDKLVCQHREVLAVADVSIELRRFACWCVRNTPTRNGKTVWDLLTDERSRLAVIAAERYCDGKATAAEMAAARDAAWNSAWNFTWNFTRDAAWAAAWTAARSATWAAARGAARAATWATTRAAAREFQSAEFERRMLAAIGEQNEAV